MQADIMQFNAQPVQSVQSQQTGKAELQTKQQVKGNTSEMKKEPAFKEVLAAEKEKSDFVDATDTTADADAADKIESGMLPEALAMQLNTQVAFLNNAIEKPLEAGAVSPSESVAFDNAAVADFKIAGSVQISGQSVTDEVKLFANTLEMTDMAEMMVNLQDTVQSEASATKMQSNKMTDAFLTGKSIGELVGNAALENGEKTAVADYKNTAMQNLDFLAKIDVSVAEAEQPQELQTILTDGMASKASQTSEAALTISRSVKLTTENGEANENNLLSGVLTDEQIMQELKNAATSVKTITPRAVASKDSADVMAALSNQLEALNEAMGIQTNSDVVGNDQNGGQLPFSQALGATQSAGSDMVSQAAESKSAASMTADYDIPKQIVEQARLFKTADASEIVIKLKPEHLGELTLKVIVGANGAVSASFRSDNPEVRGIIESSILQLKQELQQQGLKVDNIDVDIYSGQEQLFGGEGGNHAAQQHDKQQKQAIWEENEAEESNVAALDEMDMSEDENDSVDYLV